MVYDPWEEDPMDKVVEDPNPWLQVNVFELHFLLLHRVNDKGIDGNRVFEVFKLYWFIKGIGHPLGRQLKESPKLIFVKINFNFSKRCFQGGSYNSQV